MEEDFIKTLRFAGFTARIKRLSDQLLYSARALYADSETEIEPNWHLVFLLLKEEKALTVTEIGQRLGFSHPAVIKITQKMESSQYITRVTHPADSRKQLLQLSTKGQEELPELEAYWHQIQETIQEVVSQDFLDELEKIENKLQTKDLYQRYKDHVINNE